MASATFDVGTVGAGRTAPVFANSKKPLKFVTGTIAFDSSYPTNGESITTIADKFATVYGVLVSPASGYTFEYDIANKKVKAFWVDTTVDGAALAEVANTTNLSALSAVPFIAWGIGGAGAVS